MSDPKLDPEFLKIGDAARYFGVARRTIYRRIWSGELPASKIGGLYFIRKSDIEALILRGHNKPDDKVDEIDFLRCGSCLRVLLDESQVAVFCAHEGCNEPICSRCYIEGIANCTHHVPSWSDRITDARRRFASGEVPVFVTASEARLREINYINRLKIRLSQIHTLLHPLSEEALNISNWDKIIQEGDQRVDVLRLSGKVALDEYSIAQTPLNPWLLYNIPPAKGSKVGGLDLYIHAISHLPEMVRWGFDTSQFQVEELVQWVSRVADEAQKNQTYRFVVLSSTTGLSESAREAILGASARSGSAFLHQWITLYLYDMERGTLVFSPTAKWAASYAELFIPLSHSEEIEEIVNLVENHRALISYGSLTMSELQREMAYKPESIRQAFERLLTTGRYELLEMSGKDLAILTKNNR
jgi:excisionase family DNA binding protein